MSVTVQRPFLLPLATDREDIMEYLDADWAECPNSKKHEKVYVEVLQQTRAATKYNVRVRFYCASCNEHWDAEFAVSVLEGPLSWMMRN